MENKKSNSHLSESLRKKLENFPEEFPTENDWQQVRDKMMSEGLLRKKSHLKRYLLLLLLIVGISGLVTVPLWIKKQDNAVTEVLPKAERNAPEKVNAEQNKTGAENESLKNENVKPVDDEKTKSEVIAEKPRKAEGPSPLYVKSDTQQKNNSQRAGKNISAETAVISPHTETGKQDEQISNESSAPVEVKSETGIEVKEENASGGAKATEVNTVT